MERVRFASRAEYEAKVFACRECRKSDDPRERAFEAATHGLPPQVVDGPDRIDILVVSLNPRRQQGVRPPSTLEEYLALKKTFEKPQFTNWDGKRYVAALEKALPPGYSWWNTADKTIGNTRLCKCPTPDWTGEYSWAAARCVGRFLESEIELLQPRVLLVVGKKEWPTVLPLLGIEDLFGPGPHIRDAIVGGARTPTVIAKHLTRASNEYRGEVARLLGQAMSGH